MFFPYVYVALIPLFFLPYVIENIKELIIVISGSLLAICALLYGYSYGIILNSKKKYIKLRTDTYKEKIYFKEVAYVDYIEVIRPKGHKFINFLDYFLRKNNIAVADHVFNNGTVFAFLICYKNGAIRTVEYTWMYKEKRKKTVEKVEKKLKEFVNEINLALKNNEKKGV